MTQEKVTQFSTDEKWEHSYESKLKGFESAVFEDDYDSRKGIGSENEKTSLDSMSSLTHGSEFYITNPWVIENDIPSRVIEILEENIRVEICVDLNRKEYKELILKKKVFEDINIKLGSYFRIKKYFRKNEYRIEITADNQESAKEYFKKESLLKRYNESTFSKR